MSDPFSPNVNRQLMREAQIGLAFIAITVGVCGYFIYKRVNDQYRIPEHVRNAPASRAAIQEPVEPLTSAQQATQKKQNHQSRLDAIASRYSSPTNPAQDSPALERPAAESPRLTRLPPASVATQTQFQPQTPIAFDNRTSPTQLSRRDIIATPSRRDKKRDSSEPLNSVDVADSSSLPNFAPDNEFPFADTPPARMDNTTSIASRLDKRVPIPVKNRSLDSSETDETKVISKPERNLANTQQEIKNPGEFSPLRQDPTSDKILAPPTLPENIDRPTNQEFATQTSFAPPLVKQSKEAEISPEVFDLSPPVISLGQPEQPKDSWNAKPPADPATKLPMTETPQAELPQTEVSLATPPIDAIAGYHLVKQNESLWTIAQDHYGNGDWFRAIHAQNRASMPDEGELAPGITIHVPPKSELVRLWPELCPIEDAETTPKPDNSERIYVTRANDTLFHLARQRLGQASRYLEILENNRVRLPKDVHNLTRLPAGIQLVLPIR